MNQHVQARPDGALDLTHGPVPVPASSPRTGMEVPAGSTRLGPAEAFPAELGSLTLVALQVLHSRVSLQLEDEYRQAPAGPHPVTLDRHHELVEELAIRTRVAAEHGAHR